MVTGHRGRSLGGGARVAVLLSVWAAIGSLGRQVAGGGGPIRFAGTTQPAPAGRQAHASGGRVVLVRPGRRSASDFTIRSVSQADQRAERANEHPVAGEAAEAGGVRGRRPCLGRDEGAPAAVGLHPDVEGDLDVPGGVERGESVGFDLRRGLVAGDRLPRLHDSAEHDLVAGRFAQEQEAGALHVVEGQRRAGRSRGPPLEDPLQPIGEAAHLQEHPYHRGPGQVAPPDRLPCEVRVCVDDDGVRLCDVVLGKVAVQEHRFGLGLHTNLPAWS